jgi:hypothetical protein
MAATASPFSTECGTSPGGAYYPTYAKDNFCFERVIGGWRGALTVLDLRLKK